MQWERRTASITDASGKSIFEQKDVEVPVDWSMTATNIVASKYLHGQIGTPERETGVRQLVARVAETIRDWGLEGGYFSSAQDAAIFHDELVSMLVSQKVAFNSPVWFNAVSYTHLGTGTFDIKHVFARVFVLLDAKEYPALRDYYQKVATSDQQQLVLTQGN